MTRRAQWLHLSDLHRGTPGDVRWRSNRKLLLDDITERCARDGIPDLIIFTGDLANTGKASEYDLVDETIADLHAALGSKVPVVPVPGNHDLVRPHSAEIPRGLSEYFDSDSQAGRNVRKAIIDGVPDGPCLAHLREYFAPYDAWFRMQVLPTWQERGWQHTSGFLPGEFQLVASVNGLRIGLVGVNSAFLHIGEGREGNLAVETHQLGADPDRWVAETDIAFLLMHHPPAWLHSATRFHGDVYRHDRFAACLHGHMHEPVSSTGTVMGQTHRYCQAPSLLGLEHYGHNRELRTLGYGWTVLSEAETFPPTARLTIHTRLLQAVGGRPLMVDIGDHVHPQEAIPLRLPPSRREYVSDKERAVALADDRLRDADALFAQRSYAEARKRYLAVAEKLGTADPIALAERRLRAKAFFKAGACLFNDGKREAARAELDGLDATDLDADSKEALARFFAQVGDPARARLLASGTDRRTTSMIALASGEIPPEGTLDSLTRAVAAGRLAWASRFPDAIRYALQAIDETGKEDEDGKATLANALEALLTVAEVSLLGSAPRALADSAAQRIAALAERHIVEDDPGLIEVIGTTQLARWRARLALLGNDHQALAENTRRIRDAGGDDRDLSPTIHVVAEEPGASEIDSWQRRLGEAMNAASADRCAALELLAVEVPESTLIRAAAAWEYLANGAVEQAGRHARVAFDLWPGHAQRLVLARVLVGERDFAALDILLAGTASLRPEFEQLRAWALSSQPGRAAEAVGHWESYLEARPNDVNARVELAWTVYLGGNVALARESVPEMLLQLESAEEPPLDTLRRAARLIIATRIPGDNSDEHPRRLAQIALNIGAHAVYLQMWPLIDDDGRLPPPDLNALAAQGVARPMNESQVIAYLQDQLKTGAAFAALYESGQIPLEAYVSSVHAAMAHVVETLIQNEGRFVTPPASAERGPLMAKTILTGHAELLLLAHYGLLRRLDDQLGPEGGILVFRDVLGRIQQEPLELLGRSELSELPFVARAIATVTSERVIQTDVSNHATHLDAEWSAAQGYVLVSTDDHDGSSSSLALADALCEWVSQGILPSSMLPASTRLSVAKPSVDKLALDYGAVLELERVGALKLIVAGSLVPITVAPRSMVLLRERARDLRILADAAQSSIRLHECVAAMQRAGRITVIDRPNVALPPSEPGVASQVRAALTNALAWRETVHQRAETLLVSVDLLAASMFAGATPLSLMRTVQWRVEPQRLAELRDTRMATSDQVMTLGSLIAHLVPPSKRDQVVTAVIGLGLSDAWTPRDLLERARDWNGLTDVTTMRLLDRVERAARSANIDHAATAPMAVASLYALVMCKAWTAETPDLARTVTTTLLSRLIALPRGVGHPPLELGFLFMLAECYARPLDSTVASDDGKHATFSGESLYGQMWRAVRTWVDGNGTSALGAFRRAYQSSLFEFLGPQFDRDRRIHGGPAVVAANEVDGSDLEVLAVGSAIESLAIASGSWRERPLDHLTVGVGSGRAMLSIGVEALLAHCVREVSEGRFESDDSRETWTLCAPGAAASKEVRVSIDAVLVRLPSSTLARLAEGLADARRKRDGRSARLLRQLAQTPDDPAVLQRYVTHAAQAPWRVVRADPSSVLAWGGYENYPATVAELREMLSEDEPASGDSALDVFRNRAMNSWQGRFDIIHQAARVPGVIGEMWFHSRLGTDESCMPSMHDAQCVLAASDGYVIGDVLDALRHVSLMACVDAQARPELSACIAGFLEAAARGPSPETMGAIEHKLLWGCVNAVARLSWPASTESAASTVWLAWRVYHWLANEVGAAEGDTTFASLAEFANGSGTPARAALPEVLDPVRFGPGALDHRLASSLLVLTVFKAPALHLILSDASRVVIRQLSERSRTPSELELSALGPSKLGWDGPATVPELAAQLLTTLQTASPDARQATTRTEEPVKPVVRRAKRQKRRRGSKGKKRKG